MAIKVKLRQKPISGNKLSLYLDFYPAITDLKTGRKTRRQFLKKFINAPTSFKKKKVGDNYEYIPVYSPEHRTEIENTLKLCEMIRRQRENELNKPEIYSAFEMEQLRKVELSKKNFVEYFKELANKKQENWMAAYNYLEKFTAGKKSFSEIDAKFCEDYKEYLLSTPSIKIKSGLAYLSQNSASAYFNKFKAALRQAFIDGYLTVDINRKIKSIKEEQTQRDFLTAEELNKLVKTNCNNPLLKRAALFSALTGLRFSDIKKLKWKEVNKSTELGDYISFRTKKTKDPEIIPISEQAVKLMGNAGDAESNVFEGLEYSAYANKHLYQWIGAAGITKDITFHCFRHTYATLQLASGTDLWTVSKLLGHKSVKTTQIYAQIVNKAKKEAAGKIILDI